MVQVDERIAPAGDPDRNLAYLRESLLKHAPLPPDQIHPMPVSRSPELCPHPPTAGGHAPGARPGAPWARPGWPHGIARAGRSGARSNGTGCRVDRPVPEPAAHDPDVSIAQPLPAHSLAGDRGRKGGDAPAPSGCRCFHSRRPDLPGPGVGAGRSRRFGQHTIQGGKTMIQDAVRAFIEFAAAPPARIKTPDPGWLPANPAKQKHSKKRPNQAP